MNFKEFHKYFFSKIDRINYNTQSVSKLNVRNVKAGRGHANK